MKKLLLLVLAALLLMSAAAFAEELEAEPVTNGEDLIPTLAAEEVLDFTLSMDAMPEGYTMELSNYNGRLVAVFSKADDPDAVIFEAGVAYSEMFAGYTLNYNEMTAEQWMEMQELVGENYNEAAFTVTKTAHGTDVIVINENHSNSDTAEIFTIYDGYFVTVVALKLDGELTADDVDAALKLMSDMWIVPAA